MQSKVSDCPTEDEFKKHLTTSGKNLSENFENGYHNEIPCLDFTLYLEDCNGIEIFNIFASLKEKKVQIFLNTVISF